MPATKETRKGKARREHIKLRPLGCISPNEAAAELGCTGEAVKQWIYHGQLTAAKAANGYWWIRKSDFEDFIKERQGGNLEFKRHQIAIGKA